jgi:predicted amidohydrolase/N-acetylneuraminic acid mutarotase
MISVFPDQSMKAKPNTHNRSWKVSIGLLIPFLGLGLCVWGADGPGLRANRDRGYLHLGWENGNAKLQEAPVLKGPWQTVNTAAVTSCQIPMTGAGEFYRLMLPSPGKKWLKVAAVTMTSTINIESNLATMFSYMEAAASNQVDLIVFPEVALQGCPGWRENAVAPSADELAYTQDTAETVPGPSTDRLLAKANGLGIYVIVGLTEKDGTDKIYNAVVFLGPNGVIGTHRKAVHVGNDSLIWSRGPELIQVFESPLGKVGLLICAEMGGEGLSTATVPGPRLAAAGADLLVTASAWWTSAASNYDPATNLNASKAARWHVVANQAGLIGHAQCYGHSRIVDPQGRVVQDTGAAEGMVIWATEIPVPAGTWFSRKEMPAAAVTCASCTLDGLLYVMGGHDNRAASHALTNVWAYDPLTDQWTARAPLPTARHFLNQSAAAVDGNIYVVGGTGMGIPGPIIREVAVYNPKTDTWRNGAPMPTGRATLTACAVDGIIYAIGGAVEGNQQSAVVEAYDPKTNQWSKKRSMPQGRWFLTASVVDGQIYVFHGTDVFVYDPKTDTWTTKASHFSPYSWGLMSAEVDGTIYLFGGFTADWSGGYDFTLAYDPVRDEFTQRRPMLRTRGVAACVAIDGKIYLAAGVSKEPVVNPDSVLYRELDVFDPEVEFTPEQ